MANFTKSEKKIFLQKYGHILEDDKISYLRIGDNTVMPNSVFKKNRKKFQEEGTIILHS